MGDRLWLTDAAQVTRIRSELPVPTWTKPPSSLAHDAREFCLLPMRSNRRHVADAAYWLVERIREWAGTQKDAAIRLNLSHGVLQEMKKLAGRSYDRKPAVGSQPLTAEQSALLARMVELIVRRLHLYEVGMPVGEQLTVDQV